MSFSTKAFRVASRNVYGCCRHMSSTPAASSSTLTPKKSIMSHTPLPPKKLRALISLYHQADSFITPENVDAAIDKAFIDDISTRDRFMSPEKSLEQLTEEVTRRRGMSKVGQANVAQVDRESRVAWSDDRSAREQAVICALFGLEGVGKPQLELLEEEKERIEGHLQADIEQKS